MIGHNNHCPNVKEQTSVLLTGHLKVHFSKTSNLRHSFKKEDTCKGYSVNSSSSIVQYVLFLFCTKPFKECVHMNERFIWQQVCLIWLREGTDIWRAKGVWVFQFKSRTGSSSSWNGAPLVWLSPESESYGISGSSMKLRAIWSSSWSERMGTIPSTSSWSCVWKSWGMYSISG